MKRIHREGEVKFLFISEFYKIRSVRKLILALIFQSSSSSLLHPILQLSKPLEKKKVVWRERMKKPGGQPIKNSKKGSTQRDTTKTDIDGSVFVPVLATTSHRVYKRITPHALILAARQGDTKQVSLFSVRNLPGSFSYFSCGLQPPTKQHFWRPVSQKRSVSRQGVSWQPQQQLPDALHQSCPCFPPQQQPVPHSQPSWPSSFLSSFDSQGASSRQCQPRSASPPQKSSSLPLMLALTRPFRPSNARTLPPQAFSIPFC